MSTKTIKKVVLAAAIGALALAGAPGAAVAETTGPQNFTVIKIGTNTGTVIARGVITGAGAEENDRLQQPRGAPFHVEFTFPDGKLFQTITPVGPPKVEFNPVTCVAKISIFDTTLVTGGTGAYAGATGSGTANATLTVIRGRNADGSCLPETSPPIFEMSQVRAPGTLTLP
jgi:hypothetical protein